MSLEVGRTRTKAQQSPWEHWSAGGDPGYAGKARARKVLRRASDRHLHVFQRVLAQLACGFCLLSQDTWTHFLGMGVRTGRGQEFLLPVSPPSEESPRQKERRENGRGLLAPGEKRARPRPSSPGRTGVGGCTLQDEKTDLMKCIHCSCPWVEVEFMQSLL